MKEYILPADMKSLSRRLQLFSVLCQAFRKKLQHHSLGSRQFEVSTLGGIYKCDLLFMIHYKTQQRPLNTLFILFIFLFLNLLEAIFYG